MEKYFLGGRNSLRQSNETWYSRGIQEVKTIWPDMFLRWEIKPWEKSWKKTRDWITPGFVYCMGRPVTFPEGSYVIQGDTTKGHAVYHRTHQEHICLPLAGCLLLIFSLLDFFLLLFLKKYLKYMLQRKDLDTYYIIEFKLCSNLAKQVYIF